MWKMEMLPEQKQLSFFDQTGMNRIVRIKIRIILRGPHSVNSLFRVVEDIMIFYKKISLGSGLFGVRELHYTSKIVPRLDHLFWQN